MATMLGPVFPIPTERPFSMPDPPAMAPDAETLLTQIRDQFKGYDQGEEAGDLAAWLQLRFDEAKAHKAKIGVNDAIAHGYRIVRKQLAPDEVARLTEDDPHIMSSVTHTKVRGGRSWLKDILINVRDKPYTISPTPIPTLPPEAEDAIVEQLATELEALNAALGAGAPAPGGDAAGPSTGEFTPEFKARAAKLKALALERARTLAAEAATRVERRVHDRLTEAGWRQAFEAFTTDIFLFPSAILKGPFKSTVKKLRWNAGELQPVAVQSHKIARVAPDRFYPAPNASDPHSCPYVIEIVPSSVSDLIDAKAIDGVDSAAIDKLLSVAPMGSTVTQATSPDLAEPPDEATTPATAVYEVLVYNGRLPEDLMAEMDIPTKVGEQPEVEVWMCHGIVLRAVRNPNLLGRRPYYVASFEPTPGSIWGSALPQLLDDVQRVCNACLRALGRNMSYSSGPIGEYDAERLEGESDIDAVEPYRLYRTTQNQFNARSSPAMRFHTVPSTAANLLNVHSVFLKLADDVSGIPAYVLGSPAASGAGRTLGGLSLLMGNAAKGLKAVVGHIDVNIIEPMVRDVYVALMTEKDTPDEDKVDVDVVARGSAGLLQQELQQNRTVEGLQVALPAVKSGLIPLEGAQYLYREVLAGLGFDPDKIIPDPGVRAQLRTALGGGNESSAVAPRTAQEGTPLPSLDGRSDTPPDPIAPIAPQPGATQ
jgi:hypothetical protein